jgi:hypothetical protein
VVLRNRYSLLKYDRVEDLFHVENEPHAPNSDAARWEIPFVSSIDRRRHPIGAGLDESPSLLWQAVINGPGGRRVLQTVNKSAGAVKGTSRLYRKPPFTVL